MSICKGIASMSKAYKKETGHRPMFISVSGSDFDLLVEELRRKGMTYNPEGERVVKIGRGSKAMNAEEQRIVDHITSSLAKAFEPFYLGRRGMGHIGVPLRQAQGARDRLHRRAAQQGLRGMSETQAEPHGAFGQPQMMRGAHGPAVCGCRVP